MMTTNTDAVPSTPSAQWRIDGQPDPHAGHYDAERAALTLGKFTDDELANGVFMNADQPLDIARVLARDPGYHPPIVWLTAAKERIRWLSRALERALAPTPAVQAAAAPSLLAADHRGMRVDYSGLFNQATGALKRGIQEPALAEMLRQIKDHLTELGQRWYAGDTAVVDELLQLYCVEQGAREALAAAPASSAGDQGVERG
jgi:hypothetical protein